MKGIRFILHDKSDKSFHPVNYIEEENDLQFIISLFYFFKQRVPILFHTSSKLQLQFIDILNKFLEENGVSKKFLRKIDE